ncbi:MAG: ppgK [Verrucomicrobiaceae bacterium]|nr:ppgK [Verrucomicrobiaceae bacterium]
MNILMIDVGGTHIKLMVSGHDGCRKLPSGPKMTAARMAREVRKATRDWKYGAITLGYPGVVADGRPAANPGNLGNGWVKYDYEKAFGKPVRFINDAAMQALGSYQGGRMLFLGLGTSTGSALIVDDVVIPLEVGRLCLPDGDRFGERLKARRQHKEGKKKWLKSVHAAVEILQALCQPDDTVLGGGNARKIESLPKGCRLRDNRHAFIGAERLWPGADMLVMPYGTTWRITKRRKPPH